MPRSVEGFVEKVTQASQRHRERHRPTGLGFAIADSIGYVDAGQWDSVVSDSSFFLSRPYLQVLEDHSCQTVCQRYALIYRERRPVAAVLMQLADLSAAQVVKASAAPRNEASGLNRLKASLTPKARRLRDGALDRLKARILVCGNLLTWGMHGVAFAPGEDPSQLWPAVAEAFFRVRRAERLSGQTDFVMVKDPQSQRASVLPPWIASAIDRCPIIEWRILLAAADMASAYHDTPLAERYRGCCRAVVQSLADSITDDKLRQGFLKSEAIMSALAR